MIKMKNIYSAKLLRSGLLIVCAAFSLSACASASSDEHAGISDPFESVNRGIFAVNDALDQAIAEPVARGYRAAVPKPARKGFHNFLTNLRSPIYLANELLQADFSGAGRVLLRATVNTLVGVGGLFDVAGAEGIEAEAEDFGQTLAVWGAGPGPYLVLPIFGPSSVRDGIGRLADSYADPIRLYLFNTDQEEWYYARVGAQALDTRTDLIDVLEDLRKNSIDYYAAVRSTYYQRREALIQDEDPDSMNGPSIPDYDEMD